VQTVESTSDGPLLVVKVGTDVTDTTAVETPCEYGKSIVFRLDAIDAADVIAETMIRQAATAAMLGPFRTQFTIVRGDCVVVPGTTVSVPVASGLRVVTRRP
jgi:hypothetical protein